ncbi:MAG: hypothetical protein V4710_16765 [Verrucomicrobiota bacterium]
MKVTIVTVLVSLLALIYLNTAIIIGEGGGGCVLVTRLFHGLTPFYGGGEEGSWQRAHPGQSDPWWHTGAFTRLASFDDEAADSLVVMAYYLGYYATILAIIGLLLYSSRHIFSYFRRA